MQIRHFPSVVVGAIMCFHLGAAHSADDCPGGSLDVSGCKRDLAVAERRLAAASAKTEERLRETYGAGYGGAEGLGYVREAIDTLRASNRAWRQFRDKECWFLALNDGMNMSPDYASPVAEACKVERTVERAKWLER